MNMTYLDILAGRFTPVQYFDIVERSICSPVDRRLLSLACGSFEMAFDHSPSDVLAIDSIVKASRHPRKVVWETGVIMLTQLAQTNESAQRELTKMAQDTASSMRARSLFYLTDQHERKYCLELLESGVGDRSAHVAHVAAWKAVKLDLHELSIAIEDRLETIRKPIVKLELQMTVGLMRNGFYEYHNENGYNIVVAFPDRYPTMVIWPGGVSEGEVHSVGLEKLRERILESGGHGVGTTRDWQWPKTSNV